MQTDVLISFIIPAYNAADTIEKAVQSLTDVPRTEVLIVENGSTDETKQVLQRLKKKYSNIKIKGCPMQEIWEFRMQRASG